MLPGPLECNTGAGLWKISRPLPPFCSPLFLLANSAPVRVNHALVGTKKERDWPRRVVHNECNNRSGSLAPLPRPLTSSGLANKSERRLFVARKSFAGPQSAGKMVAQLDGVEKWTPLWGTSFATRMAKRKRPTSLGDLWGRQKWNYAHSEHNGRSRGN